MYHKSKTLKLQYIKYHYQVLKPELKTLEWDILNPDYLVWVSTLYIFFLNRPFLNKVEKNQKPVFLIYRVPPVSVHNLKRRAKFQIYRLYIRDSDWLNLKHFSGYKYKIRLVSILRKREDHALISISTILKFSALFR